MFGLGLGVGGWECQQGGCSVWRWSNADPLPRQPVPGATELQLRIMCLSLDLLKDVCGVMIMKTV